jgi:hypothetical protein
MDWDAKTLVDNESDADSITTMEFKELSIVLKLFYAFYRWGDEEVGP